MIGITSQLQMAPANNLPMQWRKARLLLGKTRVIRGRNLVGTTERHPSPKSIMMKINLICVQMMTYPTGKATGECVCRAGPLRLPTFQT